MRYAGAEIEWRLIGYRAVRGSGLGVFWKTSFATLTSRRRVGCQFDSEDSRELGDRFRKPTGGASQAETGRRPRSLQRTDQSLSCCTLADLFRRRRQWRSRRNLRRIESIDSLAVVAPAFAPQQDMRPAMAVMRPGGGEMVEELVDGQSELIIETNWLD